LYLDTEIVDYFAIKIFKIDWYSVLYFIKETLNKYTNYYNFKIEPRDDVEVVYFEDMGIYFD
jgi:hypothetical protein